MSVLGASVEKKVFFVTDSNRQVVSKSNMLYILFRLESFHEKRFITSSRQVKSK